MSHRTTADVIDQFNHAFVSHDPASLADLVGDDCVMEAIQLARQLTAGRLTRDG